MQSGRWCYPCLRVARRQARRLSGDLLQLLLRYLVNLDVVAPAAADQYPKKHRRPSHTEWAPDKAAQRNHANSLQFLDRKCKLLFSHWQKMCTQDSLVHRQLDRERTAALSLAQHFDAAAVGIDDGL